MLQPSSAIESEQIPAVAACLDPTFSADLLFLKAAQRFQSPLVGMVGQKAMAVRFQPSNNMSSQWATVSVELDRVCLRLSQLHVPRL